MMTLQDFKETKKIRSILCFFETNEEINLLKMMKCFPESYFIKLKSRILYLVTPCKEKGYKYIIWKKGLISATGINKIEDYKNCIDDFLRQMEKNNMIFTIKKYPVIKNIVITVDLKKSMNLSDVVHRLDNFSYEPEIFPAIIFKIDKNRTVTCLIFSTGKIVIVGIKSFEEIDEIIKKIYDVT